MSIIVDVMGGDHAPTEIIKGCVLAAREYNTQITLVGKEKIIGEHLSKVEGLAGLDLTILDAPDVIATDDPPVMAIKKKKESSMVKALQLVRQDPANVLISAGNTGALMAGGLLKVGRIKGIERPALCPFIPNSGQGSLLIDAGANADCRPGNLLQFAIMGSIYMEKVLGRKNPKVGLVNIGAEETKGNELTKAAYIQLKACDMINFIGNIEARDIPSGVADVLVCDGFVGNVILKLTEGLAISLFGILKEEMTRNLTTKLGALILKPGLKNLKKKMDYTEHGGAPLLGINGGIIKAHGSSNAIAIKNAIRQGLLYSEHGVLNTITAFAVQLKEV